MPNRQILSRLRSKVKRGRARRLGSICPRCGKKSVAPESYKIVGKNSKEYRYWRFRHPRRYSGVVIKYSYCYVKGNEIPATP